MAESRLTDPSDPDTPEPAQHSPPGPAPGSPEAADDAPDDAADEATGDATEASSADAAELSVESLLADLERVTAERDRYLDGYQRSLADLDNFRKQVQRRQEEAVQRALGGFVQRLLPVLDACDAALAHGAGEVEPILAALYQALEKEGLSRVAPEGEPFDPNLAEAVVHEPGEGGQGGPGGEQIVSEVLRAGYTWNGRVLRPAMVKVTG
jgi:molecular chaperone GrpE